MKKFLPLIFVGLFALSMSSCFVNRSTVGDGPVGKSKSTVKFSHSKQLYLFWGLVSLGQSSPTPPPDCGYQIRSCFNLADCIVSTVTGGIFSMRNVKILVNKDGRCDPAVIELEKKLDKDLQKEKKLQNQ
jgi:hypothetical protein